MQYNNQNNAFLYSQILATRGGGGALRAVLFALAIPVAFYVGLFLAIFLLVFLFYVLVFAAMAASVSVGLGVILMIIVMLFMYLVALLPWLASIFCLVMSIVAIVKTVKYPKIIMSINGSTLTITPTKKAPVMYLEVSDIMAVSNIKRKLHISTKHGFITLAVKDTLKVARILNDIARSAMVKNFLQNV